MSDPAEWLERLAELRQARRPCVLVIVTDARGSAPREAGARMLVSDGRLAWGTIGGGNLERLALERAGELLRAGRAHSESRDYPLAEATGQCCGGAVTLFFECFPWTRARIAIFGAGHVGQALAALAPHLGADVRLIDSRTPEELQPVPPATRPYELVLVDAPEAELAELPARSLVVVMTHSHALDLELVARALRLPDLAYLGLIGSERKWARFRARLEQRGFTPADLARVRCPIGLVRGPKEPGAIALSTAAELVQVLDELTRSD